MIAEFEGITIYHDGMFAASILIDPYDLIGKPEGTIERLVAWLSHHNTEANALDKIAHGAYLVDEQFFSDADVRSISEGDLADPSLREAAAQELLYRQNPWMRPWTKAQPKKSKKIPGYVYLVEADNGTYKIGVSKTPQKRIETIGVKLPYALEIIHLIKSQDSYALEQRLHDWFADKRLDGEWFTLTAEDVEYIKEIQDEH